MSEDRDPDELSIQDNISEINQEVSASEEPNSSTRGRKRTRSDSSSDDVVRKKRRKRSSSSTPKQGVKDSFATENGKTRERSKDDRKSKPVRENMEDFSDSDCSQSVVRSVRSETVSNHTFSDTSSYRRFDPHKEEKKGISLSKDMESYLNDNFNKYLSSHEG